MLICKTVTWKYMFSNRYYYYYYKYYIHWCESNHCIQYNQVALIPLDVIHNRNIYVPSVCLRWENSVQQTTITWLHRQASNPRLLITSQKRIRLSYRVRPLSLSVKTHFLFIASDTRLHKIIWLWFFINFITIIIKWNWKKKKKKKKKKRCKINWVRGILIG